MAKQNDLFTAANASAWVQPDGPNGEIYRLGCREVADVVVPKGDVTQYLCRDPHKGKWTVQARTQAPPDRSTTTFTTRGQKTADWLERYAGCAMPVYINQYDCTRLDTFNGAVRGTLLPWAVITQ